MTRQHTVVLVRSGSDSCNSLYSPCVYSPSLAPRHTDVHARVHQVLAVFKVQSDSEWGEIFARSDISRSFVVRHDILLVDYWKSTTNDWLHKI